MNEYLKIILFGIAVFICGYDLIIEGIKKLFRFAEKATSAVPVAPGLFAGAQELLSYDILKNISD